MQNRRLKDGQKRTMRNLNPDETALIARMLVSAPMHSHLIEDLAQCQVEDMDDGGMGSIRFVSPHPDRQIGLSVANLEFTDRDGVVVLVTLNLDNHGDLYELDMWKTDFSPLKSFPD